MAAITELLEDWRRGDPHAFNQAVDYLYQDLRRAAAGCLQRSPRQSLQPTVLVHEAYLRLAGGLPGPLRDRKHFLTLAAKVMRNILVDRARESSAVKRGGPYQHRISLDDVSLAMSFDLDGFLLLDRALNTLNQTHPDWVQVVELRYFGGLDLEETAESLQLSVPTVVRRQRVAEAWLHRAIAGSGPDGTS